MGNGYTRQSSGDIIDDNTIEASHFNTEFDAVQDAFNGSTGHSHDGTTGEGPLIGTLAPTVISTSTDTGATAGPIRTMYRNSASPAASDILGLIKFDGNDSGATQTTYASLQATITDPTDTSEDGTLDAYAMIGGSLTKVASFGDSIELRGTSVSATQFGYLGAMDQGVATTDSVTFDGITATTSFAVPNGLEALTSAEVDQLENIGTTTISAAQWAYLGATDQGVATTDDVTFNSVTTDTINEETADAGVTIDSLTIKDAGLFLGGAIAANFLNDYEEGTFTPTFKGTTIAGSFTYTNQDGTYTKIGNIVFITLNLSISAIGTIPIGSLNVAGLPFTASSDICEFSVLHDDITFVANDVTLIAQAVSSTELGIVVNTTTVAGSLPASRLGTNGLLRITGFYYV